VARADFRSVFVLCVGLCVCESLCEWRLLCVFVCVVCVGVKQIDCEESEYCRAPYRALFDRL
jgi:hypothetical protein